MSSQPPTSPAKPSARPAVLSLVIKDKAALYAAYMPFLLHGGLFVPTTKTYALQDDIFLVVRLMDDPTEISVAGKVAWQTPAAATNRQAQGIGVHFSADESAQKLRHRIENILGPAILSGARPTQTL